MSNFCGWWFCLLGLAGRKGLSGVLLCFVLKASVNPWGTHFCEIAHGRVPHPPPEYQLLLLLFPETVLSKLFKLSVLAVRVFPSH